MRNLIKITNYVIFRPALSLARIARNLKQDDHQEKIVVVVGTVTNDLRIFDLPKISVSHKFVVFDKERGLYSSTRVLN